MNGKFSQFRRSKLNIPSTEQEYVRQNLPEVVKFMKSKGGFVNEALVAKEIALEYRRIIKDEIWVNDQYQVNIDKDVKGFNGQLNIWHLSIKRLDKEPIHDWRDLQAIKNALVGEEYEAVEIYPAKSRVVDTANQFHLWAFVSVKGQKTSKKPPRVPIGFQGFSESNYVGYPGAKNRPFPED